MLPNFQLGLTEIQYSFVGFLRKEGTICLNLSD